MEHALSAERQNIEISQAVQREQSRLLSFVRNRVADAADAEDILQDVFSELVESYRLLRPVEQLGAWLYRVARNRIIDAFRKKRPEPFADDTLEDLLPSPDAGPEAAYTRGLLAEELAAALEELPTEQRDVFVAHEIEGRSFKDVAAETGVPVNTLLSRKRYAVLHLRRRLQAIHDEYIPPKGPKNEK